MFSQGWQIGLHINTDQVSVVAIKRNRDKWCLQGWWAFPLHEPIFTSTGLLVASAEFCSILGSFVLIYLIVIRCVSAIQYSVYCYEPFHYQARH